MEKWKQNLGECRGRQSPKTQSNEERWTLTPKREPRGRNRRRRLRRTDLQSEENSGQIVGETRRRRPHYTQTSAEVTISPWREAFDAVPRRAQVPFAFFCVVPLCFVPLVRPHVPEGAFCSRSWFQIVRRDLRGGRDHDSFRLFVSGVSITTFPNLSTYVSVVHNPPSFSFPS